MAGRERWRVLHVTDRPPGSPLAGGAEAYVDRVVAAQRVRGHEVHLFTGEDTRTSPVLDVWNPFAARALQARLRSLRPDVVHVHNVVRELSASVLGAAGGFPIVMTVHDLRAIHGGEHGHDPVRRSVDRRLLAPLLRHGVRRHVRAAVAVSDSVADELAGWAARLVVVPPPGVVPAATPEPPSRSRTVLYVGRLDEDKGVGVLAQAFATVAAADPEARLVLLGDGRLRSEVDELARRLPGQVEVRGRVPAAAVSAELTRARVVVVPSIPRLRREGLPIAAVDAACHGRPLVTSDDPGAAEVTRLVGGTVVPAEDAAALAAAITGYLDDPARADSDGERAATAAAAAYDPQIVAGQLDDVYRSVR